MLELMTGKEVRYMKKIVIGTLIPLVASLGLWLGMGAASATHKAPAQRNEVSTGADTDNIQSGDQTTPDTENAKASSESDGQGGTETENQGETESGGESEGAADAAAQHADCLKVGIDDTVTPDVQYDDQTGACSLDTGGTDNGGND